MLIDGYTSHYHLVSDFLDILSSENMDNDSTKTSDCSSVKLQVQRLAVNRLVILAVHIYVIMIIQRLI